MTFNGVVDKQFQICNWIRKNFTPVKQIQNNSSSMYLLRLIQFDIPEVNHEEFKQAMAMCGYFGDCSYCDEYYSKVFFNVSQKSINKVRRRQNE